jgi:hypothetical protein
MGDAMATIQIKVPPCPGNEAGIVTINECDFDPTRHERVGAEAAADAKGGEHGAAESHKAPERQRKKGTGAQVQEGRA